MGKPRTSASSWKWESGETVNLLNWDSNEPNQEDSMFAGVYMTTQASYVPGKWHDLENNQRIGLYTGSLGYGYICEKLTLPTTQVSTTVVGTSMQSLTSTIKLSTTRRPTSSSSTVIDRTKERSSISDETITSNTEARTYYNTTKKTTGTSDEPRTEANTGATTKLFTTASGTSSQSLTSGVQSTSISTTVRESTERTANNDEPSTKAAKGTATLLSTTVDETIQLTSGRSMQPSNNTPALPTTVTDETKEGTGTSYKPSMKTTTDKATTQLSTTASGSGISMQPFSSGIQSSSTYRIPKSTPTTVIGESTEGNNEKQITKANTNKGWMTVVYVVASFAFVIVVLVLLYRDDVLMNLEGTGQEKYPGNFANSIIKNESTNEPSESSHEADTYQVILSTSVHDKDNPDDYESEENPTYERYQEQLKSPDIDTQVEGEVDNPAYDALPFDCSESFYASPDEMTDVAGYGDVLKENDSLANLNSKRDMSMELNPQVESPGNNTIQSETKNDYASINKMTVVAGPGDVLKETAVPVDDHDEVADSNIDALYAKPDVSMKRNKQVESPGDNNYASLDKMTDVAGPGDVLTETDATAT
ncbi:cell wall integrity and stress response component 4-like [Anneissia japonica]|uniref:cell wall integrity and stress response component 4-like n=1 Tax=Anneissia japonica TaxID=1529436 RepID=UPI0014254D0A|nr:cell wall integrity and stress response component 4-like [Anneissia japonica]